METALFQPKDEKPQWQYLYDQVKDMQTDHILPWATLKALTGFDRKMITRLVYCANKHLLEDHKRRLISVRGIGYKIGNVNEQIAEATKRKGKARRQLKTGVSELINIDINTIPQEEKQRIIQMTNHFQSGLRVLRKDSIDAIEKTKESIKLQVDGVSKIDQMMNDLSMLRKNIMK